MSPGRTLPLRVPIVPGEALDSWLEALARRSQVTVGTLTAALGWPVPANPGGLVSGIPGHVLRRVEEQAGLPAGRLDVAVLDRYLPLGPIRRRGSWYCPSCLAERDGRWLLIWRLGWVFACPAHGVLLCDTCPACGRAPRGRAGRAGLNPPGTCANTIKRNNCCGADLRQVTRAGSRPATRCWPPSIGPARCSPSMTPGRPEMTPCPRPCSATWALSARGCCARHRQASSPASARTCWLPGTNGTSSPLLPGASRAGSRPPAPR